MFRKKLLIGPLAVSLTLLIAASALALGIGGIIFFNWNSIKGIIDVSGIGNYYTQPKIVIATADPQVVEICCLNPQTKNVAPGEAGSPELLAYDVIGPGNIIGKGKAKVELLFDLDEFENDDFCNNLWTAVEGSAIIPEFSVLLQAYPCTDEDLNEDDDDDPCVDIDPDTGEEVLTINRDQLLDQEERVCIWPPNQPYRDEDCVGISPVYYICTAYPEANDDSYRFKSEESYFVPAPGVLGNDSDPDGDTLTAHWVSGPPAGEGDVTLNADGSFTYTPGDFTGTTSFTYYASDGIADSNVATVTVNVR